MQIPSLDDFRHQSGVPPALPWWVDVRDADFTLMIPDSWPEGDDDGPHQPSYQQALQVLGELDTLTRKAVEYVRGIVDTSKVAVAGEPSLNEVFCDARNQRVTLRMVFDADIYALWSVTFSWREVEDGAQRFPWPVAMEYRSR
jgi:hypothetical protein